MTNLQTQSASNRRKSDRFYFENNFVLETENFQGLTKAISKNFSKNGALLSCPIKMTEGSIVSVEIPAKKLQLMGEVCWTRPENNSHHYQVGIAFHEPSPSIVAKISELVDQIKPTTKKDHAAAFHSFELENNISMFLDHHIEKIKQTSFFEFSTSVQNPRSPVEKKLHIFTPTNSLTKENKTISFRLNEPEKTKNPIPARPIVLTLLALSLFFYRTTFTNYFTNLLIETTQTIALTDLEKKANNNLQANGFTQDQVSFNNSLIEKVEWVGTADRLEIKIQFKDEILPERIETSNLTSTDQPRQLIKILNIKGSLEQKNITIEHSLVNRIRMGIHDEIGQKNLHIVLDMTNPNIKISSSNINSRTLTVNLKYSGNTLSN